MIILYKYNNKNLVTINIKYKKYRLLRIKLNMILTKVKE